MASNGFLLYSWRWLKWDHPLVMLLYTCTAGGLPWCTLSHLFLAHFGFFYLIFCPLSLFLSSFCMYFCVEQVYASCYHKYIYKYKYQRDLSITCSKLCAYCAGFPSNKALKLPFTSITRKQGTSITVALISKCIDMGRIKINHLFELVAVGGRVLI